jgi:hypothetical protein
MKEPETPTDRPIYRDDKIDTKRGKLLLGFVVSANSIFAAADAAAYQRTPLSLPLPGCGFVIAIILSTAANPSRVERGKGGCLWCQKILFQCSTAQRGVDFPIYEYGRFYHGGSR